jgi:hypothetical protein
MKPVKENGVSSEHPHHVIAKENKIKHQTAKRLRKIK